jgi:hypothetical protein
MNINSSYRRKASLRDKFFDRVCKKSKCWIWQGVVNHDGYGRFLVNGKYKMAHRFSYELKHGKILPYPEFEVDHLCKVRNCVNPDHLEVVKHVVNIRRGGNSKKTHCIHGHIFDEENTLYTKSGARQCKKCRDLKAKKYREENSEKIKKYLKKYREKRK